MSSTRDTFFMLPAELRNRVYSELLLTADGSIRDGERLPNRLAMLATSRLYHMEAASFFYSHTHFVWSTPNTTSKVPQFPPLSNSYIPMMRRLTISMRSGCPSSALASCAASMLSSFSRYPGVALNDFTIVIGAALSPALNSRFDDSVLCFTSPVTVALRRVIHSGISKSLHIRLEDAWFAPGVASDLQQKVAEYCSSCQSISFSSNYETPDSAATGLSRFERSLINRYSDEDIWKRLHDDRLESESERRSSSASSDASFASLLSGLGQTTSTGDGQNGSKDDEHEELTSDDDVDIDDSVSDMGDELNTMVNFAPDMI